jgi:hypothetical protein
MTKDGSNTRKFKPFSGQVECNFKASLDKPIYSDGTDVQNHVNLIHTKSTDEDQNIFGIVYQVLTHTNISPPKVITYSNIHIYFGEKFQLIALKNPLTSFFIKPKEGRGQVRFSFCVVSPETLVLTMPVVNIYKLFVNNDVEHPYLLQSSAAIHTLEIQSLS